MSNNQIASFILEGKGVVGIELGSTRIKAVLIGKDYTPIASSTYDWENRLEKGVWTYHLDDVWKGIQAAFAELKKEVDKQYGVRMVRLGGLGISAMMHGYLPFDKDGMQLAEFRTWRNTMTEEASTVLTEMFSFNIPQRWTIAHLYQAILNCEKHVSNIDYLTTLAGYVHWRLTGLRVVGIGEGAGILPIDAQTNDYDQTMVDKFDSLWIPLETSSHFA
jgi:sugar (pentulose or hexulose) kinase